MSNVLGNLFGAIAAAIKAKNGEEGVKYKPIEFPEKIMALTVAGGAEGDKALKVKSGEFQITTAGVKKVTHNLGVTPDIVVYFLSFLDEGTYLRPESNVLSGEIAYSAEMIKDGATRMFYLINGSALGAPFGINEKPEDIEGNFLVSNANPESFTVGTNTQNRFCPTAKYRWAAIGGLKEHNEFYTVRFYDGETLVKTEIAKFGDTVTPPELTKEGYSLDGWIPAITTVKEDATYTAKWIDEFVVVEEGMLSDTINWQLSSTGTMVVSGTGAMPDYGYQGASPFFQRNDINKVIIRSGITVVGQYAFPQCRAITSVTLPDTLTKISNYAFMYCSTLVDFAIPGNVTTIGVNIISYSQVTSITIPASVTSIAAQAFASCDQLTSVTFEVTGGWKKRKDNGTATDVDVTNPTTNATNLRSTYVLYKYYRS